MPSQDDLGQGPACSGSAVAHACSGSSSGSALDHACSGSGSASEEAAGRRFLCLFAFIWGVWMVHIAVPWASECAILGPKASIFRIWSFSDT